jgi:hypothetical protein
MNVTVKRWIQAASAGALCAQVSFAASTYSGDDASSANPAQTSQQRQPGAAPGDAVTPPEVMPATGSVTAGDVSGSTSPALNTGALASDAPAGSSLVTQSVSGTVQAVDPASGQVQISDNQGQMYTYMVDSNVQVTRKKKATPLSTIKRGDRITLKPVANPSQGQ